MIDPQLQKILSLPRIFDFQIQTIEKALLFTANIQGIPQLYQIKLDSSKCPTLLSADTFPITEFKLSPDETKILVAVDTTGNEHHDLYVFNVKTFEMAQISHDPARTIDFQWHPDSQSVFRTAIYQDQSKLQQITLTGEKKDLIVSSQPLYSFSHHPSLPQIAYTSENRKHQRLIEIFDYQTNKTNKVPILNITIPCYSPSWSHNGRNLGFFTEKKGTKTIGIVNIEDQDIEIISLDPHSEIEPDSNEIIWHPNNHDIFFSLSSQSRAQISVYSLSTKSISEIKFPLGHNIKPVINSSNNTLYCLHSSMLSSPLISALNLDSHQYHEYIIGSNQDLKENNIRVESHIFSSFDGLPIHAWIIHPNPKDALKEGIVFLHGGPYWQNFNSFDTGQQLLPFVLKGFTVIAPDFRGSTGYGLEFKEMNVGDIGGGDLHDVIHTAKYLLSSKPNLSRIGLFGASYGGYLGLLALGQYPTTFQWGVIINPIADLRKTYTEADLVYQKFFERLLGGTLDETQDLYIDRSPSTYATNIQARLLLLSARNDSRCPFQQVQYFTTQMQKNHDLLTFHAIEDLGYGNVGENVNIFYLLAKKAVDFALKSSLDYESKINHHSSELLQSIK